MRIQGITGISDVSLASSKSQPKQHLCCSDLLFLGTGISCVTLCRGLHTCRLYTWATHWMDYQVKVLHLHLATSSFLTQNPYVLAIFCGHIMNVVYASGGCIDHRLSQRPPTFHLHINPYPVDLLYIPALAQGCSSASYIYIYNCGAGTWNTPVCSRERRYGRVSGPLKVALGGPLKVALGGPLKVALGGPLKVALGGPLKVALGGPLKVALGGPLKVAGPLRWL